jgi:Zn-dependent protease
MFRKKEIAHILVIVIVIAFALTALKSLERFPYVLLSVFLVVMINIFAKKISSYYLDSEIETKIWEVQRFGFRPRNYSRKPVPMGAILPLVFMGLTYGYFIWMASLVFEVKAKVYRAAKRYGLYTFSEMTEYHIGLIAASGIIANLFFSIIGYFTGFTEFAEINIYYALFNMIPLSDLDGNKIFFGSIILWSFLASLVLVGLGYVFFVV